jgi:cytochrome c-type biogenesis protein CcmH
MTAPSRTTRDLRRSWRPWLPMLVVLAIALVVGSLGSRGAVTDDDRSLAIARTVQCPVCQGETVAESNAAAAQNIRVRIDELVRSGQSDEQIRAYLDSQFPGSVLTPPSSGIAGLVWVVPVVALVLALAGLAVAFRRWSAPADHHASPADRALVDRALAEGGEES